MPWRSPGSGSFSFWTGSGSAHAGSGGAREGRNAGNEEYVAEELRQEGFTEVDTTPKSGDFGADVLARDGERRVCVQCKRYAPGHPVGVKAVQEIYSAKAYYGCDDAYLYTTSEFTKAAMEMANELGVVLVRSQI